MWEAICRRLAALTVAAILGGCASAGMGAGGSISAPPNYRQLIAAKLRQWEDVSTIRSARITAPHQRFVGLQSGGTRPTVCVELGMPNLIGAPGTTFYVFYFDNGQVDGNKVVGAAFGHCFDQPLTKFTELVR